MSCFMGEFVHVGGMSNDKLVSETRRKMAQRLLLGHDLVVATTITI